MSEIMNHLYEFLTEFITFFMYCSIDKNILFIKETYLDLFSWNK